MDSLKPQLPKSSNVSGQLPDGLNGYDFLLKQPQDLGVEICSSRLSQFISDGLGVFHEDIENCLTVGIIEPA